MTSLFMTQREDAQGILDIGKHCFKCQRLDFLPFPCEFCNHIYCADHRTLELHSCPGKRPQRKVGEGLVLDSKDSREPVASLFPNRKNDMKKVDDSLRHPPKPTTILEKSFRVGDVAKSTSNAFSKFTKFLQKTRAASASGSAAASSKAVSKARARAVDLVALRKNARGDSKIPVPDRIYVSVKSIAADGKPEPIFVSKNWPTGRALDVIADLMKIRNYNNSTTDSEERLNMFLTSPSGEPILVGTSERCSRFKNGDEIFLVRGSI